MLGLVCKRNTKTCCFDDYGETLSPTILISPRNQIFISRSEFRGHYILTVSGPVLLSIVAARSQCFSCNREFPSTAQALIPSEIPTLSIITFRNILAAAPLITPLWALYVNRPCLSCASHRARVGGARKGLGNDDDDDCVLTTAITQLQWDQLLCTAWVITYLTSRRCIFCGTLSSGLQTKSLIS